jgi:hypothetical protein
MGIEDKLRVVLGSHGGRDRQARGQLGVQARIELSMMRTVHFADPS